MSLCSVNELSENYCIGCGLCVNATNSKAKISLNEYKMYQADIRNIEENDYETKQRFLLVCPFSDYGPNEDDISSELFSSGCEHDKDIGYHKGLYSGYVAENDFREVATSGGVITWVLSWLLENKHVDAVLHVTEDTTSSCNMFNYNVTKSIDGIKRGAKSRYYPIEMSQVISFIGNNPGKYAVVGLPCFIKGVRRLSLINQTIQKRIEFCIGLVCGHLKSGAFSDLFSWQAGINPKSLQYIDFRFKLENRKASHYGVHLKSRNKEIVKPVRDMIGYNWGHNLFRYPVCNYCDDVFSETADICVGDAWLDVYDSDSKGNSIVIVRNSFLDYIFQKNIRKGNLKLKRELLSNIKLSQAGGLRDRREGLSYRISLKYDAGEWVPKKRVEPGSYTLPERKKAIYKIRMDMGNASHAAWKKSVDNNDMSVFLSFYNKYKKQYDSKYFPFSQRVSYKAKLLAGFCKSLFFKIIGGVGSRN